jgi:hypothetical protein
MKERDKEKSLLLLAWAIQIPKNAKKFLLQIKN